MTAKSKQFSRPSRMSRRAILVGGLGVAGTALVPHSVQHAAASTCDSAALRLGIGRSQLYDYNTWRDNFSENATSWNATTGKWSVIEGSGTRFYEGESLPDDGAGRPEARSVASGMSWSNLTFRVGVIGEAWGHNGGPVAIFRYSDEQNFYSASITRGSIAVRRRVAGVEETIARARRSFVEGRYYEVDVDAYGASIDIYVDGEPTLSVTDDALASGRIGLGTWKSRARFNNVSVRNKREQYQLLNLMKSFGMNRVRLDLAEGFHHRLRDVKDLIRYCNKIDLEVALLLNMTINQELYRSGATRVPSARFFKRYRLSDLDIAKFADAYERYTRYFEGAGCEIATIIVGNEANWIGFNGDFPEVPGGVIYGHGADWQDPQLAKIREGLDKYGQAFNAAREVTDQIYGSSTAIASGGFAPLFNESFISSVDGSFMLPELYLQLLQGTHESQESSPNYLDDVDYIGAHLYPRAPYDVDPQTGYNSALAYISSVMDPIVEAIGATKPILVDEFGYARGQTTEETRLQLYLWFLDALQDPALGNVDWQDIYLYDFDTGQRRVYDAGELLPVGEVFKDYPC